MIKARVDMPDESPLVILGLSRLNCDKLLAGKPILIEGDPLGLHDVNVVIMAGETEDDIAQELETHGITLCTR